jgi:hypothetical protein
MIESDFTPYKSIAAGVINGAYVDAMARGRINLDTPEKKKIKIDGIRFFFDGRLQVWISNGLLELNANAVKKKIADNFNIDMGNPEVRIRQMEEVLRCQG